MPRSWTQVREKFIFSRPTMRSQPAVLQHIAQACTSFRKVRSPADSGTFAHTGTGSASVPLYSGAFDNAYFSGSGTTGNLYVCGNAGGAPSLYKITMAATFPGTISTGLAVSGTTTVPCSQVTEVYNGTNDWLFLSETGPGNLTGKCTTGSTGCVYNFNAVATTTGGTTITSTTVTSAD